ncbi:unnamed protein product [[Actinomadura] parvosata subsp. kistnae]|uniref:hypothetical protein n=1 Tax=[Actinomadura] parvosata TaxID=1955412 RepID=UPI000D2B1A30|nr:unnamed protein product [Actinomadura parvosata subsp. kistnae]
MIGELFRENIHLSYHQIQIRPQDELGPACPRAFGNGLVALDDEEPDGATILTGIAMGQVEMTVRLAEEAPPLDLDSWEEIVDISIESTFGSLIVCGLDGDLPRNLPNLAWKGPASTACACTRSAVTRTSTERPSPPPNAMRLSPGPPPAPRPTGCTS